MRKVGIVMGSDSDLPIIRKATDMLQKLEIPFEVHVYSAHRTPVEARDFAINARKNGFAESPFDKEDFLRISGAVLSRNGKLAGTIGISVPMLKIKDDTAVKRLQTVVTEAAIKLSEKLD